MSTTSIDDLLLGAKTPTHPQTPENQPEETPHDAQDLDDYESDEVHAEDATPDPVDDDSGDDAETQETTERTSKEYDEYGNPKERMSKGMKERLDRKEKQHQRDILQRESEINALRAQLANQGVNAQVQQAAKDFEYDPEAQGDWQHQLSSLVKHTINEMKTEELSHHQKQIDAQKQATDAQAHREFEGRFTQGMERFSDFRDVVSSQPIDDAMTLALRGMDDPASFIYAAAKRTPKELERISKLPDPYVRMVEMGKLEERMRRNKAITTAPRPLSRSNDDGGMPEPKRKSEPTIEELIAKADAKKLARVKGRRGGHR